MALLGKYWVSLKVSEIVFHLSKLGVRADSPPETFLLSGVFGFLGRRWKVVFSTMGLTTTRPTDLPTILAFLAEAGLWHQQLAEPWEESWKSTPGPDGLTRATDQKWVGSVSLVKHGRVGRVSGFQHRWAAGPSAKPITNTLPVVLTRYFPEDYAKMRNLGKIENPLARQVHYKNP